MSGICGIVAFETDYRGYTDALQHGLDAIAHRGHDGISCYNDDRIFIGHRLFDTGCNGFAVDEDGFVISFDGRLDNRNALCAQLRADGAMNSPGYDNLNDTRLLLLAYRHFGAELPKHLVGDFAIGIWDALQQHLYLFRDHFGVRPLFYRQVANDFLFGSEIKALRAIRPDIELKSRSDAMRDFATGDFEQDEPEKCFFDGVYRLLPAHWAVVKSGVVTTQCYWRLDPGLPQPMDDVPEQFRTLLMQALNRRLRGTSKVAALLSGGLDSSSIVSTIGSMLGDRISQMAVFSMLFSGVGEHDEREYIDAVREQFAFPYYPIDMTAISALGTADAILAEQDKPPFGPNGAIFRNFLHQVSARTDAKIVLHGHGGDEIVSDGTGIFDELAASGKWTRLWRELVALESVVGKPGIHFRRLIWRRGIRPKIGRLLRKSYNLFRKPVGPMKRNYVMTSPELQRRPAEQVAHLRKLTSPLYGQSLEITDHDAAFAGIELRMPFLDVELAEFCVRVEATHKWRNGLPRAVIRDAMVGILPEKVRTRNDKHDFIVHLRLTMLREDRTMIDEALFRKGGLISPYVQLAELRSDWTDLKASGEADNSVIMRIWRAVMLSRWIAGNTVPSTDTLEPPQILLAAE